MGRHKKEETLTIERTQEIMQELESLNLTKTSIAEACNRKYLAAYNWSKGKVCGPTALEKLLNTRKAEVSLA